MLDGEAKSGAGQSRPAPMLCSRVWFAQPRTARVPVQSADRPCFTKRPVSLSRVICHSSAHGPAGRPLQQFPVGPYLECQRAKYILYSVYNKSYRKKIKISIFTILSTDYFDRHGGFGTCSKGSPVGASAGTGGASQLRSR